MGEEEQLDTPEREMIANDVSGQVQKWLTEFHYDAVDRVRAEIHIDELTSRFRAPESWIAGAVASLECAIVVRSTLGMNAALAMQIFLKPTATPTNIGVGSLGQVSSLLSFVPPALIVYRSMAVPDWRDKAFHEILDIPWPLIVAPGHIYFQEWFDSEEQEFARRLWLVSDAST